MGNIIFIEYPDTCPFVDSLKDRIRGISIYNICHRGTLFPTVANHLPLCGHSLCISQHIEPDVNATRNGKPPTIYIKLNNF